MAMIASCLFVSVGCHPAPQPATPDADASALLDAVAPFGDYTCSTWCAHASELACIAAKPTEHGATCSEVCTNTLDGPMPFNVQCRSLASSCEAADRCEDGAARALTRAGDAGTIVVVIVDAGTETAVPKPTCASWCQHATALNCPAAKPTPKGAPCVEVCSNVQSGPAKFNLKCRLVAKTCAAAEVCERKP